MSSLPEAGLAADARRSLRELAEAMADEKSSSLLPHHGAAMLPEDTRQMLREVLVCQFELEIQNEELRRTQAELLASQSLYVDLYDAAPVGYCTVSEQGRILQPNRALASLLDQPRAALVDQALSRFIFHEDQDRYYLHCRQLLATGQSQVGEVRLLKADQSVLWARLDASVAAGVAGALVFRIVFSDISACKQAEQTLLEWNQMLERRMAERTWELRQSKFRFRQLAQATFEGIAISEGGKVIDGNIQLAKMHGCKLAEMIGQSVSEFVAPESRAWVKQHIDDGQEATYEYVGLRKDGSRFPAESHGRMISWQGKKTRVTALRDLTASRQAAAQLKSQEVELEHAQRLALVSEVSAGIIHQIGQPLCAMGANLAVAFGKMKACKYQYCNNNDLIQDIEGNMESLRECVARMRALAHPELPQRTVIDFNAMAEAVVRLLQRDAERLTIVLRLECDERVSPVLADKVQLSQVILNLVRNAFDACADSPSGQRAVTITTRAAASDRVELSVRDSGRGIAPAVLPQLFSPFFTTKAEGLGIGLRLSQTIVAAHGGNIKGFNNDDGIGAIFRVVLPGHGPDDLQVPRVIG